MNSLNQGTTKTESPLEGVINRLEQLSRSYEELVSIMLNKMSSISDMGRATDAPNKVPPLTRVQHSPVVTKLEETADAFNAHLNSIRSILEQLDV